MSSKWTFGEGNIQRVLNVAAPSTRAMQLMPDKGRIPVIARIVWEVDGEELMEATATRWTRLHVFVELGDVRLAGAIGVWVAAADVKRRLES